MFGKMLAQLSESQFRSIQNLTVRADQFDTAVETEILGKHW